MEDTEVRKAYRKLLKDPNLDKLELELKMPNIFKILKITGTEIRHSNFLKWLFDPNETHGLGNLFLIKFLRELVTYEEIPICLDEFEIEKLDYNNVELRREWKNIDLLILFEKHLICVENKIYSTDRSKQLSNYKDTIIEKTFEDYNRVYVYLTPTGEQPTEPGQEDFWIPYSYEKIIEQIDNVLTIYGKSMNSIVYQYISDYLITLKRELTMSAEANKLAEKIYKSHKDLFEFVFRNKPDVVMKWQPIISEIVASKWKLGSENKGFVRFLTKDIKDIIPQKIPGWPKEEGFLFELWFNGERALFKPVISKGNPPAIKKLLCDAMENIKDLPDGFTKKSKKLIDQTWAVPFQYPWDWEFEEEDLIDMDDETLKKKLNVKLNEVWEIIDPIIKEVEKQLLKYLKK